MTNNQAKTLWESLWECSDVKGVKFAYAVLKNREKLTSYLTEVSENPIVVAYEKKRIELAEKLAKKDEEGKAVIIQGRYQFEDQKVYEEAVKEMPERKEYEEFMESEAEVELHMIKQEDVSPEITANQLSGIEALIEK